MSQCNNRLPNTQWKQKNLKNGSLQDWEGEASI